MFPIIVILIIFKYEKVETTSMEYDSTLYL